MSVSIFEYIFTLCVMSVSSFLFFTSGQLVGLMPVLAACHLIYVSSIVCVVFLYMLVANKVLSLSLSLHLVQLYNNECVDCRRQDKDLSFRAVCFSFKNTLNHINSHFSVLPDQPVLPKGSPRKLGDSSIGILTCRGYVVTYAQIHVLVSKR